MTTPRHHIVLCAFQLPNQSDSGLESATSIFEALREDYDWTLVTTRETDFTERWRAGNARVIVTPFEDSGFRPAKALNYARWAARIFAAARAARADCIHANDHRAFNAASLPARLLRLPLLLTVRDTKAKGEIYGRHWHSAARQCHRIITLSKEMGRIICEATGAQPEKLRTINSIVDLARFAPPSEEERAASRAALSMAPEEFAIGCIGAIRDKKNQLELIERMLPPLVAAIPAARLHFFGDFHPEADPYAARCSEAVQRLGMQRTVVFHGHARDMATRLKALDAIVIGARNEGLARAMIEGMACGVPVVSFSVCSAREMLDDTAAGEVVLNGDHIALAEALIRLAADPKRGAEMGRCGRLVAEQKFETERVRAGYLALYNESFIHSNAAKASTLSDEGGKPKEHF